MSPLLLCRFAQTAAAVLLAGTTILRLLARGTASGHPPRWNRLAAGSGCVLAAAGILQLGLTAAAMSGRPLAQALSGEVLGSVLGGTRFGAVWQVRACLLAGLFVLRFSLRRVPPGVGAASDGVGAGLAAVLLASLVWSGHAPASPAQSAWLLPVDVAHAVAAGAWPGGLWPLASLLTWARREPGRLQAALTITRRFSRLSVVAVGILAVSGLLNGIGLVGTFSALWPTVYGRLLLCKVAGFAGMVALGAANRRLIRQDASADAAETMRRLWGNVAWETALAVWVLLATEALAMTAPPASAG